MFFSRIYDPKLAQASYLIGCQNTGDALVIDPNRDIAQYVAAAAAERLRITHVTKTHIHADFASGARELAQRTNASLLLSGAGGADWQYDFATESGARLLRDGDVISVGRLQLEAMHTPGHTPEHISFVLTDVPTAPHPVMFFSGDFVFVGDVGRPDLLEKAAKVRDTMEIGARALWQSIQRFRSLPDHVQLWPGHGAGSACGKALGAVPSSTVGYEKLVNWAVGAPDEATFMRMVLEGQPDPPAYFARMKRVNQQGPAPTNGAVPPARIDVPRFAQLRREGALVVDLRPANTFARGYIRGSINVPINKSFPTYAGSAVPYDTPIVLVAPDESGARAAEATRDLMLIGNDAVVGFVVPSDLMHATPHDTVERVAPADAISRHTQGVPLIDVRNASERAERRATGSLYIPFTSLAERIGDVPRDTKVLVQCQTGARSAIAASLLRRHGIDAADAGGLVQWEKAGGPVGVGLES